MDRKGWVRQTVSHIALAEPVKNLKMDATRYWGSPFSAGFDRVRDNSGEIEPKNTLRGDLRALSGTGKVGEPDLGLKNAQRRQCGRNFRSLETETGAN